MKTNPKVGHLTWVAVLLTGLMLVAFYGSVLRVVAPSHSRQTKPSPESFLVMETPSLSATTAAFTQTNDTTHWATYVDHRYGYNIKYPPNWYLKPTAKVGYGAVATISNYDTNKSSGRTGFTKDMIKVQIGQVDKPADSGFAEWAAATVHDILQSSVSRDYGMTLDAQMPVSVNNTTGMRYSFRYRALQPSILLYIPKNWTEAYRITAQPSDSMSLSTFETMITTLEFSKQ